jgi:hypothetical protein
VLNGISVPKSWAAWAPLLGEQRSSGNRQELRLDSQGVEATYELVLAFPPDAVPTGHHPPALSLSLADAVSWAPGRPSHPDTPPNIYEGGLGAQQQQGPSAQGSKPKNFRLRHLRSLALYLPGHMQPAGQCGSHWLGRLMAGGSLTRPEGSPWPLDLPQGTLGPGNSHCSALLEAHLPRDSLGNTGKLC